MKTIAFFGHRQVLDKTAVQERLEKLLKEIVTSESVRLLIGCHGDFDKIALSTSLKHKKNYNLETNINIVLTSLSFLKKDEYGYSKSDFYKNLGCETMFYNIEEQYFKNRIYYSNKKMVEESDLIVCYVDMTAFKSGAKKAINYARKKGKRIFNLFENNE